MKTTRRFSTAIFLLGGAWIAQADEPWIIDPHTHFKGAEQIAFESAAITRDPRDSLGHVVTPDDYRAIADRLGIQSTLVVEAADQDKPQFNEWVLDQATSDLVCGYVARGDLSSPDFVKFYDRYKNTDYLNGYRFRLNELAGYLDDDTAKTHLRRLQSDGMVVDLLVDPTQAADVVRLASEFPELKIVINHCFRARMVDGTIDQVWKNAVTDCAELSNVYMKISSIINFAGTKPFEETAPTEVDFYRPVLEHCFDTFGEDRVIFATNWGVSAHFGKVDDVVRIVKAFLSEKGDSAVKKGMRDNAIRVYGIPAHRLR